MFSSDGRFMYLISELKNYISVYTYDGSGKVPKFELQQKISTVGAKCSSVSAACAIKFTPDEKYIMCSNAGDNSVGLFERNEETGLLTQRCVLPISGEYPKDFGFFPDEMCIRDRVYTELERFSEQACITVNRQQLNEYINACRDL